MRPIPPEIEAEAIALVQKPMRTRAEKDPIIRRLTAIYLQYIEPHHYTPEHRMWANMYGRWISCGTCIEKVLTHFENLTEWKR